AVEGRDEQERHRELGQARPDEELAVLPVLAVGGRRHRDDRHRADLGGEEGQTGGPPRDAAPREEEVAGVSLLAGEGAADEEEGGERDEEDRVVGPGESAAGGSRGHGQRYYAPSPGGLAGSRRGPSPMSARRRSRERVLLLLAHPSQQLGERAGLDDTVELAPVRADQAHVLDQHVVGGPPVTHAA